MAGIVAEVTCWPDFGVAASLSGADVVVDDLESLSWAIVDGHCLVV